MPGQRRSVGAAKQRAGSSGGTGGPINNATTLMMWDGQNDYVQIVGKQIYGTGSPATLQSLSTWHNNRKARGWIVAGSALYWTTAIDHFGYYDGTNTYTANQYDNWRTTELSYTPATTGHYLSWTPQTAPFNHLTRGVLALANPYTTTGNGTPLWPWHNEAAYGTTGGAAAVAAGEGTAAWNTAVASALTPAATNGVYRTVCADFKMFCQTCAFFGHTGIAWDAEMYGYSNADGSAWQTSYPTMPGGQTAATTRLWVKLRGQQLSKIQAAQMPNSQIYFYHQRILGSWFDLYQYIGNPGTQSPTQSANRVYDSFIAGLASVAGIDKVILGESEFYKGPVISSWDNAYCYDHNAILARLSTLFTDAERLTAMRRLGLVGMLWPTSGSTGNELGNAMTLENFRTSLRTAVKWGMHGQVIVWALSMGDAPQGGGNQTQDHAVFESAFQSELVPANADNTNPVCTITAIDGVSAPGAATYSTSASTVTVSVQATHPMAIHRIEWANAANSTSGAFQHTFNNTTAGWAPLNASQAPQNASIPITFTATGTSQAITLTAGSNVLTFSAYSTHGLVGTATLTVTPTSHFTLFQSRYPASGAEIWVDGTLGNDGAAGTAVAPKATIQAAINVSVAGSKIMVRPYAPGYATHTFAGHSGNANNYIHMIAVGSTGMLDTKVKINVNGGVNPGQQGVGMIGNNANFIAMWGFELAGLNSVSAEYEVGVMVANGAHDVAVWGCYFHDLASHAFAAPGDGGQGWAGCDRIDVCYNRITRTSRWNRYQGSGISMISQANIGAAWPDGYRNHIVGNVIDNVYTDPNTFLTPPYVTDGNGMIFDISGGYAGRTLVAHNLTVGCGGRGIHTLSFDHIDAWLNTSCDCIQNLPGTWVGEFSIQGSSDCHFAWNVGAAKVGQNRVGNFESPGTSTWSDTVFLRGTGGSQQNDPSVNSYNNVNKTQSGPANYFNAYQQGSYQNTVITNVAGFRPKLAQVATFTPPANVRAAVAPWPDALGVLRPASGPWAYGAFEAA